MRIFSNHHSSLNFTSETVAAVGRFTHQQINILFVALAALSCLIISILVYRTYRAKKIEQPLLNNILHANQNQQKPVITPPLLSVPPPESPAMKAAEIFNINNEVKAKPKIDPGPPTKKTAAPTEQIPPTTVFKPASITLSNGDVWEGASPDCSGEGKMKKRDEIQEGYFLNGKLHGQGKITDSYNEIKEGLFDKGIFIEGRIYYKFPKRVGSKIYHNYLEGTFKNDLLHGRGKKVDYDLIRDGDFVKGELNGQGKIIFKDEIIWEGTFIEGKFNGNGKVNFSGKNGGNRKTVIDSAIFQEIVLVLEFMLPSNKYLTEINICIGGIEEPLPKEHCDYVYATIKGFAKLNESLAEMKQLLSEEGLFDIFRAKNIQEFAFHKENSATLISDIEHTLLIFSELYLYHKDQETLPQFLMEAFDPEMACFEARSDHLLTYHATHIPSIS